jgi:hypothetical protein
MSSVMMIDPRSPLQPLAAHAAERNILVGHRFVQSDDDRALRADDLGAYRKSSPLERGGANCSADPSSTARRLALL